MNWLKYLYLRKILGYKRVFKYIFLWGLSKITPEEDELLAIYNERKWHSKIYEIYQNKRELFTQNFSTDTVTSIVKNFNLYSKHPYTGKHFKHIVIPNFRELLQLLKNLHNKFLYFDVISWDIAINSSGEAVFIEVNTHHQEINFHQLNNGPLFGELTEDILSTVFDKNKYANHSQ